MRTKDHQPEPLTIQMQVKPKIPNATIPNLSNLITKIRTLLTLKNNKQSDRLKCSKIQPPKTNIRKDRPRKSNKNIK